MKLDKINITETIDSARKFLESDKQVSPALRAMFEMLLMIITLFAGWLGLNSRNSSKPPASDPNREKKKKNNKGNKPGGQPGRIGTNLQPVDDPDNIIPIKLDKRRLPRGDYREVGFESRQVIDIEISRIVTEYRAQILEDAEGRRHVAAFPPGVVRPIQYGQSIKAHAVYLSQFQLIPYERVADYFINEAKIPVSVGSLFNFHQEAFDLLESFDTLAKEKLMKAPLIHADETGINVNGKRLRLHNASNESCHHSLCNAHHIRELQWVIDNSGFAWAQHMQDLLIEINEAVKASPTSTLDNEIAGTMRERYRHIITSGLAEMPLPENPADTGGKKKKGL